MADLASQRDAAASLASDPKRMRSRKSEPTAATTHDDDDDDELLELALQGLDGGIPAAARGHPVSNGIVQMQKIAAGGGVTQASQTKFPPMTASQQELEADFEELDMLLGMEEAQASAALKDARLNAPESQALATAEETAQEGAAGEPQGNEKAPRAPGKQALDTILPLRSYVRPLREAIDVHGEYLTVTSATGERVYAPMCSAEGALASGNKIDIAGALRRAPGKLLSSPIEHLLREVEREQFERALVETGAVTTAQPAVADNAENASPPGDNFGENRASKKQKTRKNGTKTATKAPLSSLWVDKYAPKGYLDLLSDEQINRGVISWLKSWDPCVFRPKDEDSKTTAARKAVKAKAAATKNSGRAGGGRAGAGNEDPYERPEHKVILLAGSPGLGKTTLAHVVARHCGYRPVEINASDDRSGASLTARVLDGVQMQSVMGEKRPNCLIIDEIDGAAGGAEGRSAINALVKIITAAHGGGGKKAAAGGGKERENGFSKPQGVDAGSDSEDEEAVPGSGGRGGRSGGGFLGAMNSALANKNNNSSASPPSGTANQKLRPLMRPIICICNDLYAPALRPLRDIAKVFTFRRPSTERLAHRLQMICAAEGLRAEKSTLRVLAERAECDIRSCLNTLQFLSKKQRIVRQMDLTGLGVGQKDMTKGAFQVWGELLQQKKSANIIGRVAETDAQRYSRLYNTLLDFGDTELILCGVQESLPGLRFFDIGLHRTNQVLSLLEDADIVMRHSHKSGDYGLLKYLPAMVLQVSGLVAGHERPNVTWPRTAGEVRRRTAANQAILHQWMLSMSPSTFAAMGHGAATAQSDLLPLLPALTTPALRPVSRHLFSRDEQQCVDKLVGTLLSLGLKFSLYVEDFNQDDDDEEKTALPQGGSGGIAGRPIQRDPPLQFYPPVHRMWQFKGAAMAAVQPRRSLPMATRQMVRHEAEMEAIRRADAIRQAAAAGAVGGGRGGAEQGQTQGTPALHDGTPATGGPPQKQRTGHVPLDLAQRLREAGVTGKVAKVNPNGAPKGTWLDQLRDRQYAERTAAASAAAPNGGFAAGAARFPVLYKFHEGYTNAVKRPVLMTELL